MSNNILIELDQIPISFFYTQGNFSEFKQEFTQFKNFITTKKHQPDPNLEPLLPLLDVLLKKLPQCQQQQLIQKCYQLAGKMNDFHVQDEMVLSSPMYQDDQSLLENLLIDKHGRSSKSNSKISTPTPMTEKKVISENLIDLSPIQSQQVVKQENQVEKKVKKQALQPKSQVISKQKPIQQIRQKDISIEGQINRLVKITAINSLLLLVIITIVLLDRFY